MSYYEEPAGTEQQSNLELKAFSLRILMTVLMKSAYHLISYTFKNSDSEEEWLQRTN